ncbi:type III-A CRISPR-associated protein Csm2 [Oceanobacter sp. 3_MG-2023]|jgi:CRISPR-associated protein Csm2|uniref:type III-A CRISPR-associated protein Csm2 n=1 Tax=Oceanobacter sp. 3_MG-2023 TaxID=3062622 RepID=UPI002734A636|nr:type III-A CRISPR-associated protein Csm2 [Oceanobacter sp. 3_MG-2023]MDP2505796.1 type III-A CRISPR-associated protein Csm2 [Oceanobacter sp. 3_MG-2023]
MANEPRATLRPRNNDNNREHTPAAVLDTNAIQLETPVASLFDTIADNTAKTIANPSNNNHNKSTQLRGFYDEIVSWEQKSRNMSQEQFEEVLPLIRMINAKVAYAKGRGLVDQNFFDLIRHCLHQVKSPATMRSCKLFLEALMGFFKVYGK